MSPLEIMRERRAANKQALDELLEGPTAETRDLNTDESEKFDTLVAEIRKQDDRINELEEQERREAAAVEVRKEIPTARVSEPNPVYRRNDPQSPSFFRDLALAASTGARAHTQEATEARQRLVASQEYRAGDMTSVAGAGGEFAPPLWAVEDFVALARPGRVTADLCNGNTLPSGISSVHLPKVSGGVTVDVQQTQNSAVSDTAMTTTSVSSGITTLAGKQIISMQLIEQSGIPFDRVVLQDLAKAYAAKLDTQVLYGTNANGQLNGLVNIGTAQAFTTTQPAVASTTNANSLYYAVSKAVATVWTNLFQPANAIVMHPNRWAWILGSVDSNSRPLVIPSGSEFNPAGQGSNTVAQGNAGTFAGLPVYVDPNISLTANGTSGTTAQDEIYVLRRDELWLYESAVQSASFDATYADQLSILFRVHGYAAFIPNRYTTGASVPIRGTGLLLP